VRSLISQRRKRRWKGKGSSVNESVNRRLFCSVCNRNGLCIWVLNCLQHCKSLALAVTMENDAPLSEMVVQVTVMRECLPSTYPENILRQVKKQHKEDIEQYCLFSRRSKEMPGQFATHPTVRVTAQNIPTV